MNSKQLILSTLALLLCTGLQAQPSDSSPADTLRLTLTEAKEYALQHSRTIKSASLAVQKAERAKWEAIASMLPHADASAGYNNFLGYEMKLQMNENMPPQAIPMNPYGTLSVQATMAISGMQIVALNMRKLAIEMSRLSQNASEVDVKANITSAYHGVLIAEESKKLVEKSKGNLEALHQSTQTMLSVGMAEQTDVDLLGVQVTNIENTIRSTERNIELAYNSMRLMLGVEANTPIKLTQSLDDLLGSTEAAQRCNAQFDESQNYNVQLLDKNIELSEKQLSLQKWTYGPTLAAFYNYSNRTYFGKSEGFNMAPPHTVGLTLNVPIFSSGERLSKVRQAKFDVETAKLNREDAVEGLRVQEKQLRFTLNSAMETYEMQRQNVEVYERIFANSTQKHEHGTISSTELTTISNDLLQAQSKYISALMELFSAQTSLLKLLNAL